MICGRTDLLAPVLHTLFTLDVPRFSVHEKHAHKCTGHAWVVESAAGALVDGNVRTKHDAQADHNIHPNADVRSVVGRGRALSVFVTVVVLASREPR